LQEVDGGPPDVLISLAARRKKQVTESEWSVCRCPVRSDTRLRLGNKELVLRVEISIANTRDADCHLIGFAGAVTLKQLTQSPDGLNLPVRRHFP
jgi:hypothetical protein